MIRATVSLESVQAAEITFQSLSAELYCRALEAAGFEYCLPDATGIWTDPDPKNRFVRDEQLLGDLEFWRLGRSIDSQAVATDLHCSEVGLVREGQVISSDLLERTVVYLRHFQSAFGLDDWRQVNKSYAGEKGNIFGFSDGEFREFVKGVAEELPFLSENWRGVSKILTDIAQLESLHAIDLTRTGESGVGSSDLATLGVGKREEDSLTPVSDSQFEFGKGCASTASLGGQFSWYGQMCESSLVGFADLSSHVYEKRLQDQIILQSFVGKRLFMVESDAFVAQTAHLMLDSLIHRADEAGIDDFINSDLLTDDVADTTLNELLLNGAVLNGALSTTFSIRPFVQRIGFPEEGLDPVGMVDQFARANQFFRGWESGVGVGDYPSTLMLKSSEDSLGAQDSIVHAVDYSRQLESGFTLDDWRQVNKSYAGDKGNIFSFSDEFERSCSYLRSWESQVGMGETHSSALSKPEGSSLSMQELLDRTVSYLRHFHSAFGLDDWSLVNKSYVGDKGNIFGFSDRELREFTKGVVDDLPLFSQERKRVGKIFSELARVESHYALSIEHPVGDLVAIDEQSSRAVEKGESGQLLFGSQSRRDLSKGVVERATLESLFGWHRHSEVEGAVRIGDQSSRESIKGVVGSVAVDSRQHRDIGKGVEESTSLESRFGWHTGRDLDAAASLSDLFSKSHKKSLSDRITLQSFVGKRLFVVESDAFVAQTGELLLESLLDLHESVDVGDVGSDAALTTAFSISLFVQRIGFPEEGLDPLGVVDEVSRSAHFDRTQSSGLQSSDRISSSLSRVEGDGIGSSDLFDRAVGYLRHFHSAFGLDDWRRINREYLGDKGNIFGFSDSELREFAKDIESDFGFSSVDRKVLEKIFAEIARLESRHAIHFSRPAEDSVGSSDYSSCEIEKSSDDLISTASLQQRSVGKGVDERASLASHFGWHGERVLDDGVSIDDLSSRGVNKRVSDQITLEEFSGKMIFTVCSDAFVTETAYFLLSRLLELSDTLYIGGEITADLLTDSVADTTLNEYLLGEVALNGALGSSFSIRSLTRHIGSGGDVDPVGVTDAFSCSNRYVRRWDNPLKTDDSVHLVNSWHRPWMESITTAEQIWSGVEKSARDEIATEEWIGKQSRLHLSSGVAVDDWIGIGGLLKEYQGNKNNIASVDDQISRTTSWVRPIGDGQVVGDIASIHFRRPLGGDQFGVGDAVDITLTSSVSSMMNSFSLNEVMFNQ